jgi:spermidine/putrescine-binding protein
LAESSKQAPNNQESREELDDDSFQSENDYMSANDQKPEEDFSELQNLFEDIKNVVKQNQESKKAKKSGKDSSDGSSNYE